MQKEFALSKTASEPSDELDGNPSIHSFIVRMWLEESGKNARRNIWRGYVTHIPGDERRYFSDIDEITVFIASYLKEQE